MMPNLIPNAGAVAKKAWSVRLLGAAIFMDGLGTALSSFDADLGPVSHGTLMLIGTLLTIAALVARFIAQRGVSDVVE
jgi:hypothetical protein